MLGELTFDEAVDNTLEEIRILIKEHLYNGWDKNYCGRHTKFW
jgi:hypothetical protein